MKNNNLHNIKTLGFKTPKDYFKSFDEQLLSKLKLEEELKLEKTTGFYVPEDYFKTVDDVILKAVEAEKETKVIQLFTWKKVAYASAVAASLILMFNIFNTSDDLTFDALETATIENYLVDEHYTNYELASLLTDEDLNSENFTNTEISESLLEDYLLDNAAIEDFIIE